jgi:hypothetical protein
MARPSKFTPDRAAVIIEALTKGHGIRHAAGLALVGQATAYRWLDAGKSALAAEDEGETLTPEQIAFRDFYLGAEAASAAAAEYALGMVTNAMPKDWRAALALLERRFPDDYTKRERREISGPKDGPIEVIVQWPSGSEQPR